MSANFNDTTPAAPSGKANVKWQHDGVNVSAYVDTGSGSGSVTSVDLTMPAEFSVSGNPVTTSGTLAVSKATQSANQIYAGPTTGGAAAPTFRALVAADIPNIAESQVTSLTSDLAAKAPLASPTFTGTPAAPTATAGTNTTQLATTAFVHSAVSGVVVPSTESGASHNFLTTYDATTGAFTKAQPTESDIVNLVSDLAAKAPTTRTISTTAPLTGGGDLSADRTLAVSNATSSTVGVVKPDNSTLTISGGVLSAVSTVISGGAAAGFAWGGDGSDGAVSMDGTNTYTSFTSTTGAAPNLVYTLTRDMFATTLSVSTSKTLNTANFRIFATTSVSVSGTVQNNGGNGSGASGGSSAQTSGAIGLPMGWGSSSSAGANAKAGTTGAGGTGNNGTAGIASGAIRYVVTGTGVAGGGPGGTGGTSGANAGGSGGSGGAAGTFSGTSVAYAPPREPISALAGRSIVYGSTPDPFVASPSSGSGASGGAGGGDGTFSGGNGGAGGGAGGAGGNMVIASPTITVNSGGIIQANGGTGGNGANGASGAGGNAGGGGGGAGGTGGPGGLLMLIYHSYSNAGTVQATGGAGGSGGTAGTNRGTATGGTSGASGNTGAAGAVIQIPV